MVGCGWGGGKREVVKQGVGLAALGWVEIT